MYDNEDANAKDKSANLGDYTTKLQSAINAGMRTDIPAMNQQDWSADQTSNAAAYAGCCGQAQTVANGPNPHYRPPTLREQAEKSVGYHREEADRADRAVAFFRAHPEFDEFIRLIRAGVIQV